MARARRGCAPSVRALLRGLVEESLTTLSFDGCQLRPPEIWRPETWGHHPGLDDGPESFQDPLSPLGDSPYVEGNNSDHGRGLAMASNTAEGIPIFLMATGNIGAIKVAVMRVVKSSVINTYVESNKYRLYVILPFSGSR